MLHWAIILLTTKIDVLSLFPFPPSLSLLFALEFSLQINKELANMTVFRLRGTSQEENRNSNKEIIGDFSCGIRDPCTINVARLLENVTKTQTKSECLCTLSDSQTTSQVNG